MAQSLSARYKSISIGDRLKVKSIIVEEKVFIFGGPTLRGIPLLKTAIHTWEFISYILEKKSYIYNDKNNIPNLNLSTEYLLFKN